MEDLSEDHERAVEALQRFVALKRRQNIREVDLSFQEVKDLNLFESMYTKDEVRNLLDDAAKDIKNTVEKELENSSHTMQLLIRQLLKQAETGGLSLQINVNTLEDEFLLGEIKRREADVLTRAGPIGLGIRRGGQLDKIGTESAPLSPDKRVVADRDALKDEVDGLKEKLAALHSTLSAALKEKSALDDRVQVLEKDLADKTAAASKSEEARRKLEVQMAQEQAALRHNADAGSAAAMEELNASILALKVENSRLEEEKKAAALLADNAERESKKKISESKQFQEYKRILKNKSEELKKVRLRLRKYEPDDAEDGDA